MGWVHAAGFRPWYDHATLPILPSSHRGSAGAHSRAELVWLPRGSRRHMNAPRSVSIHVRDSLSLRPSFPGDTASGRIGLCAVQRTPGTWHWRHDPRGALHADARCGCYVLSPQRAPVPPRPGDPGCSRCGTRESETRIEENVKDYFPISSLQARTPYIGR